MLVEVEVDEVVDTRFVVCKTVEVLTEVTTVVWVVDVTNVTLVEVEVSVRVAVLVLVGVGMPRHLQAVDIWADLYLERHAGVGT